MRLPLLLLTAVLLSSVLCVAQQPPTLDVTTQSAQVDRLTLADVDFLHATTPTWLFTIQCRLMGAQTSDADMSVTVSIALAGGESFPAAFIYRTVPFTINGIRTFTNFDLLDQKLKAEYVTDEAAKKRLEQIALPSGSLPAGVYTFDVLVNLLKDRNAIQHATARFQFVLSNPSLLELIFPLDAERNASRFPMFQWNFDGKGSRLSVFDKLPSQSSLEEATTGIPYLVTDLSATSFLYPQGGVRPLEPGKTYVWFVEGLYGTSGGAGGTIRSRLRSFTVASGADPALRTMLDDLERALGQKYHPLFQLIRAGNLTPTGTIRIDGVSVSTVELLQYINQIRNSPDNVLSADLE